MKALSIKQPWAWLIIRPDVTNLAERERMERDEEFKDIENRDWPLGKRLGKLPVRIAVHASKSFDKEGYEYVKDHFPDIEMPKPNEFDMGGIIGTVVVTSCVHENDEFDEDAPAVSSEWFFGEYGFVLEGPRPTPFKAVRGQLGFFEVDL